MDFTGLAALVVALSTLVVAISGTLKVWYDLREVHKALNSRLDQLVESKGKEQLAIGKEEGRTMEVGRDKSADPAIPVLVVNKPTSPVFVEVCPMNGIFESVSGDTVTFEKDDGSSGTQRVANGATVTLNGKTSKLTDLWAGDKVTFSGDPATSVTATR